VIACLGYSRAGAGALVFSKQAPDLLSGIGRCLWSLGAAASAGLGSPSRAAHARRPPDRRFAAFCGQLKVDWHFCGELACRHERSFAKHPTITALEHARALKVDRGASAEAPVEVRPLARYDALIA
jgi:hypothetical protein